MCFHERILLVLSKTYDSEFETTESTANQIFKDALEWVR